MQKKRRQTVARRQRSSRNKLQLGGTTGAPQGKSNDTPVDLPSRPVNCTCGPTAPPPCHSLTRAGTERRHTHANTVHTFNTRPTCGSRLWSHSATVLARSHTQPRYILDAPGASGITARNVLLACSFLQLRICSNSVLSWGRIGPEQAGGGGGRQLQACQSAALGVSSH